MESCISTIRYLVVFIGVLQLQCAWALYEDLGHKCTDTEPISVHSRQPVMSYTATPYPFIAKAGNVTLNCTGRAIDAEKNPSYIHMIQILRNNKYILKCRGKAFSGSKSLSCKTTVTNVTNDNEFMCIVRASNAPCNAALIKLRVGSLLPPNVSSLHATVKQDTKELQITCIGTGIPKPTVLWLLNGSFVNERMKESLRVDTELEADENVTRVYRVTSRLVITGQNYPLRIQCAVKNDVDEVYSENVYAFHVDILSIKLTAVSLQWTMPSDVNASFLSVSGYNVSLTSGNESYPITRLYNKTTVTFSNLTMGRTYTASIQALTKKGDLLIGAVDFYSPVQVPQPNNIKLVKITSQTAVVEWDSISPNESYGVLLGYKLLLNGANRKQRFILSSNTPRVMVTDLHQRSKYAVQLCGFTQFGNGKTLEYSFLTLDAIPPPQNVTIFRTMTNFAVIKWTIIEQNEKKYEKITGYIVTIRKESKLISNITTSSQISSVLLIDLLPSTEYKVTVSGLGDETEGTPSEWITFKTAKDLQGESSHTTKETPNYTLITVCVTIAIVVCGMVAVAIAMTIRIKRRSQEMTPQNTVQMQGFFSTPNYYHDVKEMVSISNHGAIYEKGEK